MTDWRISSWSRIALTRAAISRSVRSASAVRASSSRDRASSSISRALVIAIAAWLASAPTSPASSSANAARWRRVDLDARRAGRASPVIGAAIIEWNPVRS